MVALVDHVRFDLGLPTSCALVDLDRNLVDLAVRHNCTASVERNATNRGSTGEALELLEAVRRDRTVRSMNARSLTTTVVDKLARNGIDALVVKGIALAALTGRRPADRPGNDLDLLIDPGCLLAAHRVLTSAGWVPGEEFPPPGDDSRTRYVVWNYNEAVYRRGATEVDLHWRLAPVRLRELSTQELFHRSVQVDVGGVPVRTLAPEDALAHVVANAAKDRWRSLASVVDLHFLLSSGASFERVERHFPASGVVSTARAAVEFLRGGTAGPTTPRQRRWWRGVTAQYDDRLHMTAIEAVAFRARWFSLAPTASNAVMSMCNLVLPPSAFTWSKLPARWWPLTLPERIWTAAARQVRR